MAFQLRDRSLTYQENSLDNVDEDPVSAHYILEDGVVPEEDLECPSCNTTWGQRLREVVEQTEELYTTSYTCISECGHLVHHSYKVCPFCRGTMMDHIGGKASYGSSWDPCSGSQI